MDTLAFWLPLFLLFLSALIGAVIKRRSYDHCQKKFEGSQILLPLSEEEWTCGELAVFAQGIEIIAGDGREHSFGSVLSRVLHSSEVEKIPYFIRQAPDPDTPQGRQWSKERQRLLHPPLSDKIRRSSLNSYNMLRDSFGKALRAIIGSISKDTRLGKTKDADKRLLEMQSNLTGMVPNAWEPILEKYRGKSVAIERQAGGELICEGGILEDYSDRYLLLRDVQIQEKVLLEHLGDFGRKHSSSVDILYSRNCTLLRYSLDSVLKRAVKSS